MPHPTLDKYQQNSGTSKPACEFDEHIRNSFAQYVEKHSSRLDKFQDACEDNLARNPPVTKWVADSIIFNLVSFVCIVISGGLSGYETQLRASGRIDTPEGQYVQFTETLFFVLFVLETGFRLSAYRICFLFDRHNLMDLALVGMSLLEASLRSLTVSYPLRVLRAFRLLRVLRTVRFFHELRILCNSLFNGLVSLVWAMVLVFLFSYITAVFLTDIIQSYKTNVGFDPANLELAEVWVGDAEQFMDLYFGSVGKCMLTLFQIITLESWTNGIARPAEAIVPGVIWIFLAFVLFMCFGLMNIVVGVFVEGSISTAAADAEHKLALKEAAFHRLLSELREVFALTDVDGNGQLTLEEFTRMKDDERIVKLMAEMDMVLSIEQFFEALDLDGQGSVTIDEFVQGVLRYQATPTNLDVYTVLGHVQRIHELVKEQKRRSKADKYALEKSISEMKADIALIKAAVMPRGTVPQVPEEAGLPSVSEVVMDGRVSTEGAVNMNRWMPVDCVGTENESPGSQRISAAA